MNENDTTIIIGKRGKVHKAISRGKTKAFSTLKVSWSTIPSNNNAIKSCGSNPLCIFRRKAINKETYKSGLPNLFFLAYHRTERKKNLRTTLLVALRVGRKPGLVDSKQDSRSKGCGFKSCLILH